MKNTDGNSFFRKSIFGSFLSSFFLLFLVVSSAHALPVTLAWDASADIDLSGYRVYKSNASGVYSFGAASPNLEESVPAGTAICGLEVVGDTQYFVVTAYDVFGNESLPSNELAVSPMGWSNYHFSLSFRSDDNDAIGAMFRYRDKDNYYRFSWNAEDGYRRLVKRENGVFTLLAKDTVRYQVGKIYELDIIADSAAIDVMIDGQNIFSVTDKPAGGTVALYSWQNDRSYFADPRIVDFDTGEVLLAEDFTGGPGPDWRFIDEGAEGGAANWKVSHNVLSQLSDTHTPSSKKHNIDRLGTYALYFPDPDGDDLADFMENGNGTDPLLADTDSDGVPDGLEVWWGSDPTNELSSPEPLEWDNYHVDVDLGSLDNDALGVMFRYQDSDNYYRFTWNREDGYRRLEKRHNGVFSVIAKQKSTYNVRKRYRLEILADGPVITVLVNGNTIFSGFDDSLASGGVALYSHGNKGACFDTVTVRRLADSSDLAYEDFADGTAPGWKSVDEGLASYPSKWVVKKGIYVQYSDISLPSNDPFDISKLGTYSFFQGH